MTMTKETAVFDFIFGSSALKTRLVEPAESLRGRSERPYRLSGTHTVLGTPIEAEPPAGMSEIVVAMGCFWGAERLFWQTDGIWTTAVGYAGGHTPHPTYEETCTGQTAHTEVVRVVFDPSVVSLDEVLRIFWEGHDPTQGMRQGNDMGTQYRSAIYWTTPEQRDAALRSRDAYAEQLRAAGLGEVTTEIRPLSPEQPDGAGPLYYAEEYHQQYLHKNPNGYCGLGGTGVACSLPAAEAGRPTLER
jgi:peptide-methionine (S)-S-oxide reductase